MSKPSKIPQLSFNAGEISEELLGRIDLDKYRSGLLVCSNFIIKSHGAITRRPGTLYVSEVKDSANPPRIIPFIFNEVQSYILELGDEYARFYMRGGQLYENTPNYTKITEGGDIKLTQGGAIKVTQQTDPTAAPYEIATPFQIEDIPRVQYTQKGDLMWLTHGDYQTQQLTRSGHTSWTMTNWTSENGPFMDENDNESITLTASGVTQDTTITLTASSGIFDTGHVGALFRLDLDDYSDYSTWEPDKGYADTDIVRWDVNVYSVLNNDGNSGNTAPVHLEGAAWDGKANSSMRWQYLHSGYGVVRVTEYISATQVRATVVKRLPNTSATFKWREGAFSDYRGWPAACCLFQNRLWLAATAYQPQTVWGSVLGNPNDFTIGDLADDAVTFTISARQANPIRMLSEGIALFAHTSKRVFQVSGTSSGPIKPDDIVVKSLVSEGSIGVMAEDINRTLVFVDQSGRKIQELGYQIEADDNATNELTKLATHIGDTSKLLQYDGYEEYEADGNIILPEPTSIANESDSNGEITLPDGSTVTATSYAKPIIGFKQLAWQSEPFESLWSCRTDGTLVSMTYSKVEDVWAWSRHPMKNGAAHSVATIPDPNSYYDQLWLVVQRVIDGATVSYIEYMSGTVEPSDENDKSNYNFLDSSIIFSGTNETSFTGATHLAGQTCRVWADGVDVGDVTISDTGTFSLDTPADDVVVGIHTRSYAIGLPLAQMTSELHNISKLDVRFMDTLGGKAGTTEGLSEINFRNISHNMDDSPPLASEDIEINALGGYNKDSKWMICQDSAGPMTVQAIFPRYK